ncbi:MAG: hypothetical protein B6U97_03815 [Candidatus Altiarchaeales archaeon ex4484_96]|nr:MAG: hypothetical protein B6U97_03815 [Candidatus Altiarchaeales archaeon ex4484_96]
MADKEDEIKQEQDIDVKKYLPVALVIVFMLLGFHLRSYHMNYPVIGYHNWKETHYLTEARNFARDGFFRHGFFIPAWDYPYRHDDPSGAHADTFPTTSILAALSFMIFGLELWAARIIGILATTACIPLMYLIVKELFKRDDMALVASFLTAINPLFVFFSHNVQLINVGILLALTALYAFLLWKKNRVGIYLIVSFAFLSLAALTKYPFLITLIPILAVYPLKEEGFKKIKQKPTPHIISIALLALIPAWMTYIGGATEGISTAEVTYIEPWRVTTQEFWQITPSYIADSITFIGLGIALAGILILAIDCREKIDSEKIFLWSAVFASIIFILIMARKIQHHNYHYYYIMPFALILASYAIVRLSDLTKRLRIEGKKIKYLNILAIIVLLAVIIPSSLEAKNRQYDTQFFGLDIAGEYLKAHKSPGDRLIHSSHQAYGVLWHADMKGTRGIPKNLTEFKYAEQELNATWLFIYSWDLDLMQDPDTKELWDYISDNYRLVQIAFMQQNNQQAAPIYLLLSRGGSFDINNASALLKDKQVKQRYYKTTKGDVRVDYIDVEQ